MTVLDIFQTGVTSMDGKSGSQEPVRYMCVYSTTRALLANTQLPSPARTQTHAQQCHIHSLSLGAVASVAKNMTDKITTGRSDQLLISSWSTLILTIKYHK